MAAFFFPLWFSDTENIPEIFRQLMLILCLRRNTYFSLNCGYYKQRLVASHSGAVGGEVAAAINILS